MTHPLKFRQHVLKTKQDECLSFAQAAECFSLGIATLKRWSVHVEPKAYEWRKIRKIDLATLRRDVEDYPDAYQRDLW